MAGQERRVVVVLEPELAAPGSRPRGVASKRTTDERRWREDVSLRAAADIARTIGAELVAVSVSGSPSPRELRHAFSYGAVSGVLVHEPDLARRGEVDVARLLAATLDGVPADLVVAGAEDRRSPVAGLPAALAECLGFGWCRGVLGATHDGAGLTLTALSDDGARELDSDWQEPVVVSVSPRAVGGTPKLPSYFDVLAGADRPVRVVAAEQLTDADALPGLPARAPAAARGDVLGDVRRVFAADDAAGLAAYLRLIGAA